MIDFNLRTEALIGGQSTTLNALADKPHVRRGSRLNDFIVILMLKNEFEKIGGTLENRVKLMRTDEDETLKIRNNMIFPMWSFCFII